MQNKKNWSENMIECPHCGYKGEFVLLRTWRYRWWDVFYYQCPKCSGKFRYQEDPQNKHKSYVIKVGKSAHKSREK